MSRVLLLAVNRHQERYFNDIAGCRSDTDVLHDSKLPWVFIPSSLTRKQSELVKEIAHLKLITADQEATGYRVHFIKRLYLNAKYHAETYVFVQRALKLLKRNKFSLIGLWSGRKWRQRIVCELLELEGSETKTLFFENGAFPDTTTVDPKGVNYASSIPRDAEHYQNVCDVDMSRLPSRLTARKGRKSVSVSSQTLPDRFVFVPFQVDSDTQIVEYSPWVKNMEQLFEIVSSLKSQLGTRIPTIVIKEHPSSKNDYAYLHQRCPEIVFFNGENTQTLIERADFVVTVNSSVGFEGLLLNKPVITLGEAFYNIDGLVMTARDASELSEACRDIHPPKPDLREGFLFYLYQEYYIPGSWKECSAEHLSSVSARIERELED